MTRVFTALALSALLVGCLESEVELYIDVDGKITCTTSEMEGVTVPLNDPFCEELLRSRRKAHIRYSHRIK
jgi:hypothetical protein